MTFPCTRCGCCCRRVGNIAGFPEPVLPDGSCSHLTPANECAIYDIRPMVCRIDEGRAVHAPGFAPDEWTQLNADACNAFQVEDGVDESFRVQIPAV